MKKVGIVTLYGNVNYGNRLQNYAVQTILKRYGYESVTLVGILNPFKYIVKNIIVFVKACLGNKTAKRSLIMSIFNKTEFKTKKLLVRKGNFSNRIAKKFSFFVVGSDQVWNPEIRKKERDVFFLSFANDSQKVCISPSIGVKNIDNSLIEQYKIALRKFTYLTCREKEGAELITNITGRECQNTIDPTLVLTEDEWKSFEKKINIKNKYLVEFFLGDIDPLLIEKINKYANDNSLEIINPLKESSDYAMLDPREFVWLIDNAEMVFTDSFHVTAFSINLRTNFYVFNRKALDIVSCHMSSRIESLVTLFGLHERFIQNIDTLFINANCDFSKKDECLDYERNKFLCILEKSISNCKKKGC